MLFITSTRTLIAFAILWWDSLWVSMFTMIVQLRWTFCQHFRQRFLSLHFFLLNWANNRSSCFIVGIILRQIICSSALFLIYNSIQSRSSMDNQIAMSIDIRRLIGINIWFFIIFRHWIRLRKGLIHLMIIDPIPPILKLVILA